MPLTPGAPVADTIRELVHHGSHPRPMRQIVAIAESNHRRAFGGPIGRDVGGALQPPVSQMPSGAISPGVQSVLKTYSGLPNERLRELAQQYGNSPQGQIVNRILQARQMGQMPNPQSSPMASAPNGPMSPAMQAPGVQQQPQQQTPFRRGGIVHLAMGGNPMGISGSAASPWWTRSEERNSDSGFLRGDTLGRSDKLLATAPAGAYVLPADVIAGLGDGNSLAGARVWDEILHSLPYGIEGGGARGRGLPAAHARAPQEEGFARGGHRKGIGAPVPVALSHGEIVVGPHDVERIGHGNHKAGWAVLDEFVKHARAKHIETLKNLKPPVGSKSA